MFGPFDKAEESEVSSWAVKVAARLWMLQTSFADDPPQTRREYLVEEIERSLKEVAESRREEYLAALMDRFPGPERFEFGSAAVPPPQTEAPKRTPLQLVQELIAQIPQLPSETRVAIAQRLQAAGLLIPQGKGTELPAELIGKIGMTPAEPVDEERLAKVFAALFDMVVMLDHLIWSVWKNIAPKSALRRDTDTANLRRTVGRCLAGDREVATLQVTQILDKTRQLTAGLLSAIGPAGETYARQHLEKFAPEKIRTSIESKSPGFLGNIEQKCWRRYLELAGDLSGQVVQKQMVDAIVSYTEALFFRPETRGH
jgi:hypothetical protein